MLDSSVLLLNHNFEPLTMCTARRAIVLVWTGKAEVLEKTEHLVRSVSMSMHVPSVIRLLIFVKITHRLNIQLTKQNIIRRDQRTCQYCGRTESFMTVDHVVPKSQGGLDTWENLVCACSTCNNRKGNRTLEDAGMHLLRTPRKPTIISFLFSHKGTVTDTWKMYLKIT